MDYLKLVNAIQKQDARNEINKVARQITDIPTQLASFLNQYDPVEVEILMKNLSAVKFYSYDYLEQLQREYGLGEEYYVFATQNSDPIAIYKQKIVTLSHGSRNSIAEDVAKNFNEYIMDLMENMK